MTNSKYFFSAILATSLFFTACDDDDNVVVNDEELITTVELTFTENGNTSTYTIEDPDGDGGDAPIKETIQLAANTAYTVNIRFLDESAPSDVENITEEVEEEADEHLVCFSTTGDLAEPTITDTDSQGNPLGLSSAVATGDAGNATFTVLLKHEPDKSATNACATGDTDVEVMFDVVVQ